MQQDKKKSYTHYMSATRPVSYPIHVQWYFYIRNGFRNFFRKSILVSQHTMIWLRIQPPKSPITDLRAITPHMDPLLIFEKPIKARFLALFQVPTLPIVPEDTSTDASTTLSASSPNATVLRTSASGFNAKKTIEELIKEMTPSNAESKKKGEDFVMILQQRLEEEDENSDAKRERVVKVLETKILYP